MKIDIDLHERFKPKGHGGVKLSPEVYEEVFEGRKIPEGVAEFIADSRNVDLMTDKDIKGMRAEISELETDAKVIKNRITNLNALIEEYESKNGKVQ